MSLLPDLYKIVSGWLSRRSDQNIQDIWKINILEDKKPVTFQNIAIFAIANIKPGINSPDTINQDFYRFIKNNAAPEDVVALWIAGYLVQYIILARLNLCKLENIKKNASKTIEFLIKTYRGSAKKDMDLLINILNNTSLEQPLQKFFRNMIWFVDLIRAYDMKQNKAIKLDTFKIQTRIMENQELEFPIALDLFDLYSLNGSDLPEETVRMLYIG